MEKVIHVVDLLRLMEWDEKVNVYSESGKYVSSKDGLHFAGEILEEGGSVVLSSPVRCVYRSVFDRIMIRID